MVNRSRKNRKSLRGGSKVTAKFVDENNIKLCFNVNLDKAISGLSVADVAKLQAARKAADKQASEDAEVAAAAASTAETDKGGEERDVVDITDQKQKNLENLLNYMPIGSEVNVVIPPGSNTESLPGDLIEDEGKVYKIVSIYPDGIATIEDITNGKQYTDIPVENLKPKSNPVGGGYKRRKSRRKTKRSNKSRKVKRTKRSRKSFRKSKKSKKRTKRR